MTSDSYTCADCGKTYPKGWSDEEAAAERERDFPGMPDDEAVVVCDDCYRAMQERAQSVGVQWAFDFLGAAIAAVEQSDNLTSALPGWYDWRLSRAEWEALG